jgi:glycosyltransferase involved in cell wall biosynthesis
VRAVWRALRDVDAIWVCGPGPVAVLVALIAVARRRRVVLGVRQNTMAYARSRFPGRRGPLLAFRLMEGVWRALARVAPVATVGPELHALYGHARRRHELAVSFVADRDVAGPEVEAARTYGGTVTLLSVGRLETEKNPLLLADVLSALVREGGDWRLDVVGEGPLEAPLRERLAARGVADRCRLLGYVPLDGGLFDRYRSSDLFLHVSWTEGLPQVLLEAFAARLPVVATDVGGVGAVAGGAALLVAPGDAAAAAAAVRRLVADAELRHALVQEGVRRVRERTAEAERRRLVAFIRPG